MTLSRLPSDVPPARVGPLAQLPVFFALRGRRVLVAGGASAAAWKAELMSAAGAQVTVVAPEQSDELSTLAAEPPHGAITIHCRQWAVSDLTDCALAIGQFEDDNEAERFAKAARAAGVPVNLVDKPAFCDFSFGAIVNRSPLVIGISTDGAAPVFGQAIRAKVEALLPMGFSAWAKVAQAWRAALVRSELSFAGRRRFWQLFASRALRRPNEPPSADEFVSFLAQARSEGEAAVAGTVMLVGAGPGDPELLTLRAVRALQSADVILYDDLVSGEVLDFARREAKKMLVGKTGHGPSCRQEDINDLMIALARSGRQVVRLKGGDPMIFGRATEEIAACRAANVAVEVVPGVTAAQGAAARLGVSLTRRGIARRLQYVSGHDHSGELPELDWASLADPASTTVVYMPIKTLERMAARMTAAGLDPATPAIAISRATRPDEKVTVGTIADLARCLAHHPPNGPVLVLIGKALADYERETVDMAVGNLASTLRG